MNEAKKIENKKYFLYMYLILNIYDEIHIFIFMIIMTSGYNILLPH